MADEFEWVSEGSPNNEEEKNKLPVIVKEKRKHTAGHKFLFVTGKVLLVAGTLILAMFARILWLLAKLKVPTVTVPKIVKVYLSRFILWGSSIRVNRPAWVKIPNFLYQIRIPSHLTEALLSGLFFILILSGAGAFFAIFSKADYMINYILLFAGLVSTGWLIWRRSAATIVANWLLQIMRNRKIKR